MAVTASFLTKASGSVHADSASVRNASDGAGEGEAETASWSVLAIKAMRSEASGDDDDGALANPLAAIIATRMDGVMSWGFRLGVHRWRTRLR